MLADSVCFCMCVYSIVYLRRGRERRGGRKGGGVVWRWRSEREEYSFVQKYLPYKVWGTNVRRGERVGLE